MPSEPESQASPDAVIDGLACARCERIGGLMAPIADGPRGLIYQHIFDRDCPERGLDD
jgi:hypothetical protein